MRRRVAFSRDTLQVHQLPPTEFMELNERPALGGLAPLVPAVLAGVLMLTIIVAGGLVLLRGLLQQLRFQIEPAVPLVMGLAITVSAIWRFRTRPDNRESIFGHLLWQLPLLVASGLVLTHDRMSVYVLLVGPALASIAVLAMVAGKQFAYWTTAHPLVGWQEVRAWKRHWRALLTGPVPVECPEILTTRLALAVLPIQFGLGFEVLSAAAADVSRPLVQDNAGLLGLAAAVLPLPVYWWLWNHSGAVPRMPFGATMRATTSMLGVWLAYFDSDLPRPGVFHLPDRWCRLAPLRLFLVAWPLALLGMSLPYLGPESGLFSDRSLLTGVVQGLGEFWPFPGVGLVQFLLTFVCVAAIPLLVFAIVLWFVIGSLLGRYWLALEAPGGYAQSRTKSNWSIAVDRILNSSDKREAEHLLLGRAIFGGYPVLLHKALLQQHAHLLGDSGSRKTSLGIAPLIAQLIAARDCSVVVVDLKGDRALFETARLEAQHSGAEFRWFTTEPGHSSHVFNPFEQSHVGRLDRLQITQNVLTALSLDYGDAYGKGFFSAMNEIVLLTYLRRYNVRSFRQLHTLIRDELAYLVAGGTSKDWKHAQHLSVLCDRLASIEPLNVTREELAGRPEAQAAAIDVGEIFSRPQVVYFNLRSPIAPIGSPAIAKMVMYALFTGAAHRLPHQNQRVYVVIDEFQQVVSDNIRLVLEQARALKLSFLIAHQAQGQLDRRGVDVRDTVNSCTAFKQYFRISDEKDRKELMDQSGEVLYEVLSWEQQIDRSLGVDHDQSFSPQRAANETVTVQETVGTRLDRNTLMDISAAPQTSIVHFTEGSGFTQFGGYATPVISEFHISAEEYARRDSAAWPPVTPDTILVPLATGDLSLWPVLPRDREASPPAPPSDANPDDDWEQRLGGLDAPVRPPANTSIPETDEDHIP